MEQSMTDIVVFGEDFGGLPSSTQHIIKKLAFNHRILWINSIGLRQPKFNIKDAKRLSSKLVSFMTNKKVSFQKTSYQSTLDTSISDEKNLAHSFKNIEVVNLLTIPAPNTKWARYIATKMMQTQLVPILKSLNFINPVYWTSLPTAVDICLAMNARATIYYCGDDFGSLAGVDHEVVLKHEKLLIENADLIFCASDELTLSFPKEKTVTLYHGVDYNLFSKPAIRANDLPPSSRKILGFYGSISNWLDYELIEQVAIRAKDWDLVFIGQNERHQNHLPQ
ncbi:glycosyl transferase, partial [Vibrio agarivorans]